MIQDILTNNTGEASGTSSLLPNNAGSEAPVTETEGTGSSSPAVTISPLEVQRRELSALRVTTSTVVSPEVVALTVDGVGFFALGDVHAVKAKQKQGKTSVLKVCAAAVVGGSQFRLRSGLPQGSRVLYLDTEQKLSDVKLIVSDVQQMTELPASTIDERLLVYALRRRDYDTLLQDLQLLVDDVRPQLVVIDGVVEFVASFNDESLAKKLIHDLIVMAEDRQAAIVCVLHTNKQDEDHNMRGHLGTMLAQKAGTVLECRKDGGVITASCSDARHREMPSWSICFDSDGHLCAADELFSRLVAEKKAEAERKREEKQQERMNERLQTALRIIRDHGGRVPRLEFIMQMVKETLLERSTVSRFLKLQVAAGKLKEEKKFVSAPDDLALPFAP